MPVYSTTSFSLVSIIYQHCANDGFKDIIIDITADQFGNDNLIITTKEILYKEFEAQNRNDFTLYLDQFISKKEFPKYYAPLFEKIIKQIETQKRR